MTLRPMQNEERFDSTRVGEQTSPGIVTLAGHDREYGWKVTSATGTTGGTTKRTGDNPIEFTATYKLASDSFDSQNNDDFALWDTFERYLRTLAKSGSAVAIEHPLLARQEITDVVVKKIGGMLWDGLGGASVTVTYLEHRPAKPQPTTTASPSAGSTARTDPNAARKAELAALTEQARQL